MGDRHRPQRHARRRPRRCIASFAPAWPPSPRRRAARSHSLRRQRQTRQHPRADGRGGRRRRPGRRRVAVGRFVHPHRERRGPPHDDVPDHPPRLRLPVPDPGRAAPGRQGRRHGHRVRRQRRQPDGVRIVGRGKLPDPPDLDHGGDLPGDLAGARALLEPAGLEAPAAAGRAQGRREEGRGRARRQAEGRSRKGDPGRGPKSDRRRPPDGRRHVGARGPTVPLGAGKPAGQSRGAEGRPEDQGSGRRKRRPAPPPDRRKPNQPGAAPPARRRAVARPAESRAGAAPGRRRPRRCRPQAPAAPEREDCGRHAAVHQGPGPGQRLRRRRSARRAAPARGRRPSPQDPAVVRARSAIATSASAPTACWRSCRAARGDARMRVLNADGSEAEMCGNGIRCVAKVLYETDPALRRPCCASTQALGSWNARSTVDATAPSRSVAVEMGRPRLTRDEIPLAPGGAGARRARAHHRRGGRTFAFTGGLDGKPARGHLRRRPTADLRALAETYGPLLETAATFPRRTNVEFARVRGGEIDLVVWERGCGITLACGTGACATVVAACLEERASPARPRDAGSPAGRHARHHRRARRRVRGVDRRPHARPRRRSSFVAGGRPGSSKRRARQRRLSRARTASPARRRRGTGARGARRRGG